MARETPDESAAAGRTVGSGKTLVRALCDAGLRGPTAIRAGADGADGKSSRDSTPITLAEMLRASRVRQLAADGRPDGERGAKTGRSRRLRAAMSTW